MSKVEVDKVIPQSGTTLTIGDSGDTINLVGTLQSNGSPLPGDISEVVAGTGLSGGGTSGAVTINIEAAQPTITSLGTITSFRSTGIDDNADATAITIDSSERVGIGTSAPEQALHIQSDSGIRAERFAANSGSANLDLRKSRNATVGSHTVLQNGDSIGGLIFRGSDGSQFENAAAISAQVDGTPGTDDMPGRLTFSTTPDGANSYTERMRIDSSGRVGIGGTPSEATHILLAQGSNGTLLMSELENLSGPVNYQLTADDGDDCRVTFGDKADNGRGRIVYSNASEYMSFETNNLSEKMRISSAGDVGIGLTNPAHKLSVFDSSTGIVARFATTGNRSLDISSADNGIYAGAHWNRDVNSAGGIQSFSTEGNENMRISSTGIVVNESSQDLDFRVESNNNANMLFVDGGNDRVGIGTASPGVTFQVDTPTQNAHVTNIKISQGGWSNSIDKLKSLAWGDPNTLGAIGLMYDGSKANMKWHSFYNGGYKSETTTLMTLTGTGNLSVSGSISKGSGSFTIDHPLPSKKETHNLVHSFVEAPQADNIYRGKIDLVNGTATINIDTNSEMSDGTFVLLNREIQCFTSNETGWTAVKGSVSGNTLTITAQDNTCDDTISWMVIGERQDQHMYDTEWTDENGKVIVEPLKEIETTTLENA